MKKKKKKKRISLGMNSTIIYPSIYYTRMKLKEYLRVNKLTLFIKLGIFGILCLIYGFFVALVYHFIPVPLKINETLFFTGIESNYIRRDLLFNALLCLFLTLLSFLGLQSGTGAKNSFINSNNDANMILFLPINPYVAYISSKLVNFFKTSTVATLAILLLFGPLFIYIKIYLWKIILILLFIYISVEFVTILSDLIFISFQKLRSSSFRFCFCCVG